MSTVGSLLLLRVATRPNVWREWLEACGVKPRGSLMGPTVELTSHLIQAVATCTEGSLVLRCLIEDELQAGKLAAPFDFRLSYYVAYPATKAEISSIAAFREWLVATP